MDPLERVVAFAASTDLGAAREFYGNVLGLEIVSEDDFALVARSGTVDVRIAKVDAFTPQPFTILGWTVDNVAATATSLADRGVEFVRYDGMDQDDAGVWSSPSGARVAWFRDPDGNVLSLTQPG